MISVATLMITSAAHAIDSVQRFDARAVLLSYSQRTSHVGIFNYFNYLNRKVFVQT